MKNSLTECSFHVLLQEHRVLIPEEEKRKNNSRRVTAFFLQCDNDVIVQPLDDSQPHGSLAGLHGSSVQQKRLCSRALL